MTTHGTPTGYTNGCHGEASCTNHRTGRMTCAEANVRYAGDYAYRKAVDAGTATDEREVFAKEKRKTTRVVVHVQRTPRPPRPNRVLTPATVHGKRHAYQAGCRDRATCPMPAGNQCPDAQLAYTRARPSRKAA